AFLEDSLGCRRYAKDVLITPRRPTIRVGPIDRKEIPFFSYREVLMPDAVDDGYADWHKLDNQRVRQRDWGLWVHTFRTFVPPEKYFADHPEYFTEQNGLRVPDGQICLTNPDVFKLVVAALRERMKTQPEARYWSVSQNDTFSPCQCPACLALNEKYGGPSGTILAFVNRVAREFPDKIISTLAYQYSRQAPTGIRPEKNVNIMLCTIECNRSRPIAIDPLNASFTKDIRDWSRLTDNIILWDYVVQFRNYCDPFPNLRVLQPNIEFFRSNGVRLMFQQGSATSRSELHELRTYLIAKLLWDPKANVEALTDDFLEGFYGPAAKYLRRYLRLMHDALDRTGGDLGIYGFPWDGIRTYLTPKLLDTYSGLFDKAEAAVAGDTVLKGRVKLARLPLEFAILEISKRNVTPKYSLFDKAKSGDFSNPIMEERMRKFVFWADQLGFSRLDETGTTPEAYQIELTSFLTYGLVAHAGLNKPVRIATPWSEKYPVGGPKALTDGLKGTPDYHCNWLGFEGLEMEAVADLGKSTEIRSVSLDFLQDINSWIWVPEKVDILVSDNGSDFEQVGALSRKTDPKKGGAIIERFACGFDPRQARYVKVKTRSFLQCPPWHKGAGGKAWIFTDEIVIE
ncbi:MAG: DUF4838 domain-containing protein, partial [Candidatus Aminicenantes bacterium]|nr:DUF4838 domain-containing protein [Candidatus Aminicenantes bacterium]